MAALPETVDHHVLKEDARGIPRSLPLLASLVEAEARRHVAVAAVSDLALAFRGGVGATSAAIPALSVGEFLERIHFFIHYDGSCYAVAGVYLTRFLSSAAAREAGVQIEPRTAHRLVSVALFLAAKFVGPVSAAMVFQVSSSCAIRATEIVALEWPFLRAIGFRLFVEDDYFMWFCGFLERGPQAAHRSCGGRKRKAAEAVDDVEDERRVVRSCLPPPAMASH